MTAVVLIIISAYGGIAQIPMQSEAECAKAADAINKPIVYRMATCISGVAGKITIDGKQ